MLSNREERDGAIPAAENGGHARSAAAHLGTNVHEHTKPITDLKHGMTPGEIGEPPQDIKRAGKQHR